MSTALAVVQDEPTLEELATGINRDGHEAERLLADAGDKAWEALALMAAAGRGLNAVRSQVPGSWQGWLAANFDFSYDTALNWMRLADHWDVVVEARATTLTGALRLIQGLSSQWTTHTRRGSSPETRAEANRLVRSGVDRKTVAALLGVSPSTITVWTNPQAARIRRDKEKVQRRRAARALRREELQREVAKSDNKALQEAWSLHLRLCQKLDAAARAAESHEAAQHIFNALQAVYHAENEIAEALHVPPPRYKVDRRDRVSPQ